MQRVDDRIHIGDIDDAGDPGLIRDRDVTAVLKLTAREPRNAYPRSVTVADHPLIDGPRNDPGDLRDAVVALLDLLAANETVFVHCAAGISRSGTVTAAAIAERDGIAIEAAVERVQDRKPDVVPHPALLDQARAVLADR